MKMLLPDVNTFSKAVQKQAYVEVRCGMNHSGNWMPGKGYICRYARGNVHINDTGLVSKPHECHLCGCYWCLPATTPKDKQICANCGGPLIITTDNSVWPDVLMVRNFVGEDNGNE